MDEHIIETAKEYIYNLYKENFDGHDYGHTIRVYMNTLMISSQYENVDVEIVSLAALLHDVDDYKVFNTIDNSNARTFLEMCGYSEEYINRVCSIINIVSFSSNPEKKELSLEEMIVQDADRLDAIGAIGIARTFMYGGNHARSIEETIEHIRKKLLKIGNLLNTELAREIGKSRIIMVEQYLTELINEMFL